MQIIGIANNIHLSGNIVCTLVSKLKAIEFFIVIFEMSLNLNFEISIRHEFFMYT